MDHGDLDAHSGYLAESRYLAEGGYFAESEYLDTDYGSQHYSHAVRMITREQRGEARAIRVSCIFFLTRE